MFAQKKPTILRPPCAAPEEEFLARCIHCGQCAQVCPHGSISLRSGFKHILDHARHTPEIIAQEKPCYLCMKCPPVCPSGALSSEVMDLAKREAMHEIMQAEKGGKDQNEESLDKKAQDERAHADTMAMAKATAAANIAAMAEANMGQAYILEDRCHNHNGGIMCWTCYDRCPFRGTAIILAGGFTPAVTSACVGCGICEYVCPVMASGALEKAIFVVPKGAPQPKGTIDTLPPPILKPTSPVSPNVSEKPTYHKVDHAILHDTIHDSHDSNMDNSMVNSIDISTVAANIKSIIITKS